MGHEWARMGTNGHEWARHPNRPTRVALGAPLQTTRHGHDGYARARTTVFHVETLGKRKIRPIPEMPHHLPEHGSGCVWLPPQGGCARLVVERGVAAGLDAVSNIATN